MQDNSTLSKQQLLELIQAQTNTLAQNEQQLAQNEQQLARKDDVIKQLESKIEEQKKEYLKLWKERFEAKSERYIADPDQLRLDFGDTPEAADAAAGLQTAIDEACEDEEEKPGQGKRRPRKKKSFALPEHLPRREVIVDVPADQKQCDTHGEKTLLPESMWDTTEKLIYIPAKFEILRTKHKAYACQSHPECGIGSSERPTGIVEGDKYDTSIAAQIIAFKYAYHMPLNRQENIFAGTGWTPTRSAMLNILQNCFFIIKPLLAYLKETLLRDSVIACDDTGVKFLYPKVLPEFDLNDPRQKRAAEVFEKALAENKPSINAKMWAYRGVEVKLNVFDFTVSRHRDGPESFFKDYHGTILGDCWHGFGAIAAQSDDRIVCAACSSHARRKFEDAVDYPADRHRWMQWYMDLFDVEDECKALLKEGLSREEFLEKKRALRQAKAKPIWDLMAAELAAIEIRTKQVVLPKSDFRKALNYLKNHWDELTRYLEDPELPIDNNECEQLMKKTPPEYPGKDRLFDRRKTSKSRYFHTFACCSMAT